MRFVIAIVSFVVAIALIGYGVAQRTFLAQPDELVASLDSSSTAAVTVIDGNTLNSFDGSQTLTISGTGPIFAAYGRTTDVEAWIGDTTRTNVTFDEKTGDLASDVVEGAEATVPDPNGSDLWLDQYSKEDLLSLTVNVPADVSFIIVSDGTAPAPGSIAVSWPVDNSTPWAGPLIVAGSGLLLFGLAMLLWALHHMRTHAGRRRKPPKMPKVPRQRSITRAKPKALEPTSGSRRANRNGFVALLPVVVVSAIALSGCSTGATNELQADSLPVPSASSTDGSETVQLEPPAVTVRQAKRIVADIATIAATADKSRDPKLIETRFSGPALELRVADYAIRGADASIAAQPAIPNGEIQVVLPQQTSTWPRTVFVVVQDDADETASWMGLMLIQDDPRSQYKVHYAVTLEPSVVLPPVAPATLGAPRLESSVGLLEMIPDELALAYGDILLVGAESVHYDKFKAEGDTLRTAVGVDAKKKQRSQLSTTASLSFSAAAGAGQTIVLATNDSGAIVAVNLTETTVVKPVETGAAVNPTGAVKALSGIGVSVKGIQATYGEQLLFYVPAAGTHAKVELLGFSQGLVKAVELK